MSLKPHGQKAPSAAGTQERDFVEMPRPEEGSQIVQLGLLVDLGLHQKLPKFAKDSKGVKETNEDGSYKIIMPKEGDKGFEHKIAAYVDLLNETHDFGEKIGTKNVRLPLHKVSRGLSEGLTLTTVAPRDPKGNYVKGKPWILAATSQWYKIAGVVYTEQRQKVSDIIFDARYDNEELNNVALLLGKPFMMEVQVKVNVVGEGDNAKEFVNINLKSPMSLMKGLTAPAALTGAVAVLMDDVDLLEPKDFLGGARKIDMLRVADIRKVVLAQNYQGSKMQEAIRVVHDEAAMLKDAQERHAKNISGDKELQEVLKLVSQGAVAPVASAPAAAAPAPTSTPSAPAPTPEQLNEDAPF